MKKCISIIMMVLFVTAACSGCGQKMQTRSIQEDLLFDAGSLEELEDLSKQIVQGKFYDDPREDLQGDESITLYGATISSFEITKVYKGDFEVGDVIQVGEEYYIDESDGQKTLVHFGNYLPSEVGKEYLMFFDNPPKNSKRWKDTYTPICGEKGRYPVVAPGTCSAADVDNMTNEELNLDTGDSSFYRHLYKDVIEKYMSE